MGAVCSTGIDEEQSTRPWICVLEGIFQAALQLEWILEVRDIEVQEVDGTFPKLTKDKALICPRCFPPSEAWRFLLFFSLSQGEAYSFTSAMVGTVNVDQYCKYTDCVCQGHAASRVLQ